MPIFIEPKVCHCGNVYYPSCGESNARFKKRESCSTKCGAQLRERRRKAKADGREKKV